MENKLPESAVESAQKTKTPKTKRSEKSRQTDLINTENASSVPFAVVEAYKSIRVQLTSVLDKINGKVVAVSSPNASEGKSTTAVNIAITLSQLNKKVIILDADIRRGTIHQKLKLENDTGCGEVLLGKAELESAIKSYSPNFDVITCGSNTNNASEIFDTPKFDELLQKLKEKYDYIILDTPPVNIVSDALVIAKKSDGLLLIIRSSFTTYDAFRRSINSTEKLGVNLLGVVLNAVDISSGKYYKRGYYGKYGKYGKYGYYYDYNRQTK